MERGEFTDESRSSMRPIAMKLEEAASNGNRGENEKSARQRTTAATPTTTSLLASGCGLTSLKNGNDGGGGGGGGGCTDIVTKQDNNNASQPCWENLPSVILFKIFSYLPHKSRIQASQVCRHWRYALFHPSFWKKITFTLVDNDSILWSRCLSSWFQFSVQEVTIRCESAHRFVREALFVLKKLAGNRQLRKLFLEPNRCLFEYPTQEINSAKLLKKLLHIVETSNCLEALSLGCTEELAKNLTYILEPLQHNHANHLTQLSLASVKDDPDRYDFLELDCSMFKNFPRLTMLTIDYDHVCDELLLALNNGIMERLVIHIHGWDGQHVGTSNNTWVAFTQKNPRCELRLNLIHSYNAVKVLSTKILQAAMPLTHLKGLFCQSINIMALHTINNWYSNTFQSLIWIDSFDSHTSPLHFVYDYDDTNNPDPIVLAAWRCKKLSELVFIGHKYFSNNLLAVVRLRYKMLKRLEFAESDIVYEEPWTEREAFIDEVKEVMGKQWKLLSDEELPKVVINPLSGDSREVIMPMVLRDQK